MSVVMNERRMPGATGHVLLTVAQSRRACWQAILSEVSGATRRFEGKGGGEEETWVWSPEENVRHDSMPCHRGGSVHRCTLWHRVTRYRARSFDLEARSATTSPRRAQLARAMNHPEEVIRAYRQSVPRPRSVLVRAYTCANLSRCWRLHLSTGN